MVRFSRAYGSYNKDEEATFKADHEAWLASKKLAVIIRKEPSVAKPEDPKPPLGKDDPGDAKTRQTTVGPQNRK